MGDIACTEGRRQGPEFLAKSVIKSKTESGVEDGTPLVREGPLCISPS